MDFQKLLEQEKITNFPIGFGGCRISSNNFDLCDYDLTIFDEKSDPTKTILFENHMIKLHHGSLRETQSKILTQYTDMQILQDDSWELRMFLSKVNKNRLNLFQDHAKNCIIESLFCSQKCIDGLDSSNVFAACWQKCSSYYLAEAICALNQKRSSPSHMLDIMRKLEKTTINKQISPVHENVGIERATPILLKRMLKSTVGFSELTGDDDCSKAIIQKHDFFVKNSMLSDCYFYLGCINKENFIKIKNIDRQPDLIHILKIAFDIEADDTLLIQQSNSIQKACKSLLQDEF